MATEEERKKLSLLADDLASLENYIHELFSFSPLPICFVSPIGVVLEVNPSFEGLAKMKSYELIGESIEKVFNKEEIESLAKETLEKGSVKKKRMVFSPKEGGKVVVQAFTRAREDEKGEVVGYFLGVFDMTGIEEAQGELRSSQTALMNILEDTEEERQKAEEERNKTQEIIASLTDGLLVFDKENRLSLVNPQAESFLGIEKEKMVGKYISDLSRLPKTKKLFQLIGKKTISLFRQELKIGENFILEVSRAPLVVDKKKIGSLIVLHDVSREKIIEKLKTEFVSISAHQLRTPLSAIKWTLRMLLDEDLGKINQEQRQFIEKTYQSNERMISLINDLLNVTRIEEGRYLYKPALTNISPILEFVINSYKDEVAKRKIKIEFKKTSQKIPKVLLDVEKMKLAFQNIIDNAIKYTTPGDKVTVTLNYDKKKVVVSIKDTGVGIPKDQQKRVFTKFFRGANVMKMETSGSGLGLFIAKNIIDSHSGKVWFESEEGKGTTFYFSLPVKKK
ncbi:MAG: ATP-binding protein [Patescibacteria group bacterium]|nr:ATP-binding protein [Patescibacteria group bacterium]